MQEVNAEGENKDEKEKKEKKEAKGEEDNKNVSADDEDAEDNKLWADVDKDLGDILAEAESGNKSSDEDDEPHASGERYDRWELYSYAHLFHEGNSSDLYDVEKCENIENIVGFVLLSYDDFVLNVSFCLILQ